MRHAAGDGYTSTGSLRQNALGVLGILFLVLSAQAPLTGVAGAALVAIAIGNGPGVPAMYVVAGVVVLLFSVGYVAMGRHVVDAGAFYSYVGKGLGGTAAAGSAGVALLAYHAIQAAVYGLFGAVMNRLALQYLERDVPWWLFALGTMVIVQVLGATGVDVCRQAFAWPFMARAGAGGDGRPAEGHPRVRLGRPCESLPPRTLPRSRGKGSANPSNPTNRSNRSNRPNRPNRSRERIHASGRPRARRSLRHRATSAGGGRRQHTA
uniref:hypothetical protein n=1 Tax=Streptomyces sp. TG1A-60 TaxID=3129111 RepID=UPI0040402B00